MPVESENQLKRQADDGDDGALVAVNTKRPRNELVASNNNKQIMDAVNNDL